MNVNKLFPRLTISAKLAIAFVILALAPLVIVGALGTRAALEELRRSAEAGLEHDMELAYTRTARSLREIEQHVTYVAQITGVDLLGASGSVEVDGGIIESYLLWDPSPLFRFKAIDAGGFQRLVVDQRAPSGAAEMTGGFEPLYQWAAAGLDPSSRAILPIEVRAGEDSTEVTPAIAVVVPVYDGGEFLGAIVGEAEAEPLFSGLELSAPGLVGGVTALADEEGRFLFHSEHKREWASLLVGRPDLDILSDLPPDVARQVISGDEGEVRLEDGRFLSYRSISVGSPPSRSLVLYRTLPAAFVAARIRRFLFVFGGMGLLLGAVVLAVSAVAARQITRPVYALRNAARELTRGGTPDSVVIETNDELEDLGGDFNRMATALSEHRAGLETLVASRTAQLLKTEAHLGRIVTDAADAILALGSSGEITLWNRGAQELFGYTQSEALGRSAAELLGPTNGAGGPEAIPPEAVIDGTDVAVNFRTKRRAKDGRWIPVTVTKSEVHDEQGTTVGHSLIIRDERARESLEEQMRRSERLAAISVMAGGIAHEIDNPLSILGNRIELMQREAIHQDAGIAMLEDLEVLRKHVGRIGSVTSDLVKFARDEADDLGAVDVNAIVDRVTRLLRKVFLETGIQLEVDAMDDLPFVLGSDSVVETILVNLLLNAQQATPPGGSVRVVTARGQSGRAVRLEVHDSGPGIPEDLRLRVFEPFFTTKAEKGGTGLGLAVCRTLLDRVGGGLELVSCEGKGASFIVSLPQRVEVPA